MLVSGVGAATVVMFGIETKLRLDGGRVDAVGVQAAADSQCQLHVASGTLSLEVKLDLDVQTANQFGVAELPDVDVVARDNTREVFDVGLDVVNANAGGDSLEENAGGSLAERNSGREDDGGDDKRNHRIHVEAPAIVREPDEECDSDDTDVAKGVAQDVKEDTAHVEVSVRVAALRLLLGLRVPVLVVVDGLALGASITGVLTTQEGLVRRSVSVGVVCVIRDLLIVVFGFKVFHASGCDDGLAESAGVDVDVIESGVPRARSTVPTLCVPCRRRERGLFVHSGSVAQLRWGVLLIVTVSCMVVRMRVTLLRMRNLVAVSMAMSAVAVSVAVLVEEEQTHDVRSQTQASHDQNQFGLCNLLRFDESLNSLEEDADTQRDQEDTVDKRAERLGTLPSIGIHFRARL